MTSSSSAKRSTRSGGAVVDDGHVAVVVRRRLRQHPGAAGRQRALVGRTADGWRRSCRPRRPRRRPAPGRRRARRRCGRRAGRRRRRSGATATSTPAGRSAQVGQRDQRRLRRVDRAGGHRPPGEVARRVRTGCRRARPRPRSGPGRCRASRRRAPSRRGRRPAVGRGPRPGASSRPTSMRPGDEVLHLALVVGVEDVVEVAARGRGTSARKPVPDRDDLGVVGHRAEQRAVGAASRPSSSGRPQTRAADEVDAARRWSAPSPAPRARRGSGARCRAPCGRPRRRRPSWPGRSRRSPPRAAAALTSSTRSIASAAPGLQRGEVSTRTARSAVHFDLHAARCRAGPAAARRSVWPEVLRARVAGQVRAGLGRDRPRMSPRLNAALSTRNHGQRPSRSAMSSPAPSAPSIAVGGHHRRRRPCTGRRAVAAQAEAVEAPGDLRPGASRGHQPQRHRARRRRAAGSTRRSCRPRRPR